MGQRNDLGGETVTLLVLKRFGCVVQVEKWSLDHLDVRDIE
jgi:hypothetical protein